jgi:repressor LexA
MNPTPKQRAYLDFIRKYVELHRRAPSEHEMQAFFKVSPPAVHQMIVTLEKKGFIAREPGKARSIRLVRGPLGGPLDEPEYLQRVERLARAVVHQALCEGSFEPFSGEGAKTDLQRAIVELAGAVRYVHHPGDGCLEHEARGTAKRR